MLMKENQIRYRICMYGKTIDLIAGAGSLTFQSKIVRACTPMHLAISALVCP